MKPLPPEKIIFDDFSDLVREIKLPDPPVPKPKKVKDKPKSTQTELWTS